MSVTLIVRMAVSVAPALSWIVYVIVSAPAVLIRGVYLIWLLTIWTVPRWAPVAETIFSASVFGGGLARSLSVSLARTLTVIAVWSLVAATSSLATGRSLTELTVTLNVVSVNPPSRSVARTVTAPVPNLLAGYVSIRTPLTIAVVAAPLVTVLDWTEYMSWASVSWASS